MDSLKELIRSQTFIEACLHHDVKHEQTQMVVRDGIDCEMFNGVRHLYETHTMLMSEMDYETKIKNGSMPMKYIQFQLHQYAQSDQGRANNYPFWIFPVLAPNTKKK
eukprot:837213_1